MIDRALNYGRHHIEHFLGSAGEYKSVLDLGAGTGEDLLLARKINPKAALYAVEAHPQYVCELLKKEIHVYSLNIEQDLLPFNDDAIDIVIMNQVLEHTKEVFWIFHEISRILSIGGRVILGVPNLAALHNRILLAVGKQPSPIKTNSAHVRGFTKKDVLMFLETCFPGGYRLQLFGGSNFYPFPPILAKLFAKMVPTMAWGIFFLLEKKKEYKREFLDFPIMEQLETNFYLGKKNCDSELA